MSHWIFMGISTSISQNYITKSFIRMFFDVNITKEDLQDMFYEKKQFQIVIIQSNKTFSESIKVCKSIGGEMAVPNDNVKIEDFSKAIQASGESKFWTGYEDIEEEGKFVSYLSGKPLHENIFQWNGDEPDNW